MERALARNTTRSFRTISARVFGSHGSPEMTCSVSRQQSAYSVNAANTSSAAPASEREYERKMVGRRSWPVRNLLAQYAGRYDLKSGTKTANRRVAQPPGLR